MMRQGWLNYNVGALSEGSTEVSNIFQLLNNIILWGKRTDRSIKRKVRKQDHLLFKDNTWPNDRVKHKNWATALKFDIPQ